MGAATSHRTRWVLQGLALVILLAATLEFTSEQIGRWQDSQHRFRIGRSVDIGGRCLNIDCSGSGSPAVIPESGGGGYVNHAYAAECCWRGVTPTLPGAVIPANSGKLCDLRLDYPPTITPSPESHGTRPGIVVSPLGSFVMGERPNSVAARMKLS